ncbi:MAG: Mur ligase family protein, partial [Bacteroidota bacterium]
MKGQRLLVLGAGESGCGAAALGQALGMEVAVWDQSGISPGRLQQLAAMGIVGESNCVKEIDEFAPHLVIKSPGIAPEIPWVQRALDQGYRVVDEIEFAAAHTQAKLVGITGTNGKTTTTLLTHHLLVRGGIRAGLAGNMGKSFAGAVALDLHKPLDQKPDVYVLEVSSFQLDALDQTRFDIGVITNITPDHLDRYGYVMQNYVNSKFRMIRNMSQESHFVWCSDDPISAQQILKTAQGPYRSYTFSYRKPLAFTQGAFVDRDHIHTLINAETMSIPLNELALNGRHNAYNSMAAAVVAQLMEVRKESIRESLT